MPDTNAARWTDRVDEYTGLNVRYTMPAEDRFRELIAEARALAGTIADALDESYPDDADEYRGLAYALYLVDAGQNGVTGTCVPGGPDDE